MVLSGDYSEDGDKSATMEDGIEYLFDDSNDIEDDVAMYRTLEQQEQAVEIKQLQQRFVESVGSDDDGESDDDSEKEEEDDNDDSEIGMVYPVRITKTELARHVNLLLTEKESVCHYSTVINFSGFLRSQYSKHWGKYHYCYTYLHGFERHEMSVLLKEHVKYCKTLKPQRVSYPDKEDASVQFTNVQKMLMAPFVGYSDLECTLKSENDVDDVSTGIEQPEKKSTEVKYQAHTPASYFTKFVSIVPDFTLPRL